MENFQQIQQGENETINVRMTTANEEMAQKNRDIIVRLLDVFKHCAERGHALRGHRDDGVPSIDTDDYVNLGNFKAAVASHARYDHVLRKHLESAADSSYATYLSKYAQTDMTQVLLEHMQDGVLKELRHQSGRFLYSISADEVTDSSNTEQLAVVIRSVGPTGDIRERLLEYCDLESMTGESVADALMDCLSRHGLSLEDCRGQTYDGAANMSGKFRGAQAVIARIQPLAVYHHCSSHKLNLALNSTSSVTEFRVMIENVKRLGIFFNYSPKRTHILQTILEKANPPIAKKKVV